MASKTNHYKAWTDTQDTALMHMYRLSYTPRQMSDQLKRTEAAVSARLCVLRNEGKLERFNPVEDSESAITMMEAHKEITPPRHVSTEEWVWHGFFFLTGALMTFSLMQIIGT